MFELFRLARFRFSIKAGAKGLILPPYKGATFRGGFGSVFRRITCAMHQQDCRGCLMREQCPYAYIFETAPPQDAKALSKYESIPRPFVIEPPLETKRNYLPGETLHFHLVLFGQAIQYLPYFIMVFREMGEVGLGNGRRPFNLEEVAATGLDEETVIYSSDNSVVKNIDLSYCGNKLLERFPKKAERIRIVFDTPVQLKHSGKTVFHPEFHIFFRQAMRRISSLMYFHHNQPLLVDYSALTEHSKRVLMTENTTRWHDWERYSQRQQQRLNMGGLIGTVVYEGVMDDFLPFLVLGEQVHVGKYAVFGLGKYRIFVS